MSVNTLDRIIADFEKSLTIDHGYTETEAPDALLQVISQYTGVPTLDYHTKASPVQPTIEKGLLHGYAAVWRDSDGLPYIDGFQDETVEHSWDDTIREAKENMRKTGKNHLLPHLYSHQKDSVIGGVVQLIPDSRGIEYQTKLALKVPKAQEVYELAKAGILGTSYGYIPVLTEQGLHPKTRKPIRRLLKVTVFELSATAWAANPYTTANAKSMVFQHLKASGASPDTVKRLFNKLDDALTHLQLQAVRSRE